MFQRVADENGEAAVGRVSSKWSSGELKLYYSERMCLCSVVFVYPDKICAQVLDEWRFVRVCWGKSAEDHSSS